MPQGLPAITPDMRFDEAARAVIAFLHRRMPWGYWSVGRISGGVQAHLFSDGNAFGVPEGIEIPLEQSLCVRMLAGEGPRIAPDLRAVPAYAAAPVVAAFDLAAYAGAPIYEGDGELFGTLCGLSRDPAEGDVEADLELIHLLADLLSMVLVADRHRDGLAAAARRADGGQDPLTGLADRSTWTDLLIGAEIAHAKFGDPAAVLVLDVCRPPQPVGGPGGRAGDGCRIRSAEAVLAATRHLPGPPTVARLGPDQLGVLLPGHRAGEAEEVRAAICARLVAAGSLAPDDDLLDAAAVLPFPGALAAADEALHRIQRRRHARSLA